MSSVSSCRRLAVTGIATLAAFATMAGSAFAADAGCPATTLSNPFAPWGDQADYALAPAGDIEDAGASWALTGGAAAQEGNETFMVTSPTDHTSLRLSGTSSATTGRMCIGVEHSSFRFFVKRSGGSSASRLAVDVVIDDTRGRERSLTVGYVTGSSAWAPSPSVPTVVNLLAPLSDNSIDVSFRFRPVGDGVWSVDDLYVDPYRTH